MSPLWEQYGVGIACVVLALELIALMLCLLVTIGYVLVRWVVT